MGLARLPHGRLIAAHQPAKPPEREPIVVPTAPIPPQPAVAPPDANGRNALAHHAR